MWLIHRVSLDNNLLHYGIKGQKWGVRRFQNEDRTWTEAGKERYGDNGKRKKSAFVSSGSIGAKKNSERSISTVEIKNAHDEKQSFHDRRKARLLEKGLTEEQAENQIKFENRAAAIATVTALALGAGATYALVNRHNIDTDFTLKGGTDMFRVSTNQDASVQDMFYATTNKVDSKKYAGMYARQLNGELFGEANGKDVYQKMLSPKDDIKIAGTKTGEKVFNELKNDPKFVRSLYPDGLKYLSDKDVMENNDELEFWTYDVFNQDTIMSQKNTGAAKMFFEALQKKGYGGVIDINDSKYSGYEANRPVILFNQKSNVDIKSVRKLSNKEIDSNFNFANNVIAAQQFIKDQSLYTATILEIGAGSIGVAGYSYLSNLNMDKIPAAATSSNQTNKKSA